MGVDQVTRPLVSIILCVRNGMPHVREAVESVRAQTYGNCELVIQDAASTDGTKEYLQSLSGFPSMTFVSERDGGQGQGFNRALKRCRGEIIGSVDADNRLKPHAVATAVAAFASRPGAAVVYGACDMVDGEGRFLHTFVPAEFDVLKLLDGSIVPPFGTSYFSPRLCGDALYFDEDFTHVPDFALWLRLARLPIHRILDSLSDVRASEKSSTYTPADYEPIFRYKLLASARYFSGPGRDHILEQLERRDRAGIYLWVVDSMHVIGGPQEKIDEYFVKALDGADLQSERFRGIVSRARPVIHALTAMLERELLGYGRAFLDRMQPEAALVYFELLERSGASAPELPVLVADARRKAKELHVAASIDVINALHDRMQAVIDARDRHLAERMIEMQAEIDRRERLSVDMHDHLQGEVNRRDALLKEVYDTPGVALLVRLMKRRGTRTVGSE